MNGDHKRNTGPMLSSLRCGAKTRSGRPCRSPSVHGKRRCRMHGGALGSGAPRGNRNALKHGRYTREAICGARAHSRTGAGSAQVAPPDRVTCVADHLAAIGSPALRQPRPKHANFARTMWSDPAGDPAALRPVLKGLLGSALLHSNREHECDFPHATHAAALAQLSDRCLAFS